MIGATKKKGLVDDRQMPSLTGLTVISILTEKDSGRECVMRRDENPSMDFDATFIFLNRKTGFGFFRILQRPDDVKSIPPKWKKKKVARTTITIKILTRPCNTVNTTLLTVNVVVGFFCPMVSLVHNDSEERNQPPI